jgi:NAD(P)H-flavin reductase/2-polyprenyl-6-methoxyphenol hydroxylase-like FAD-dependent oxidoreductase/ferredoxin
MRHEVTLRYLGGVERRMSVGADQTILEAAEANGLPIVNECQSGVCGTCIGACSSGRYEMGRAEGLSDVEREAGKLLTCQTTVQSDCVLELQYPFGDNAAQLLSGEGRVIAVEQVSPTTALLRIDASGLGAAIDYRPGQYAQIRVPGSDQWRSYSYAHPPRDDQQLEFIVRLLPEGAMSDYLRRVAKPGDAVSLRCSKGGFYLRQVTRPVVLVAGGTGLSAILAMAQRLASQPLDQPVTLLYGVTHYEDLCKLDELRALSERQPRLVVHSIVARPDARWTGPVGVVTDLLNDIALNDGDVDIYLCGPAAMVEATRGWLARAGLQRAGLHYEKFVASGSGRRARQTAPINTQALDLAAIAEAGRGTAVVVGGSIAGIATAKVLREHFGRVIVLEKDGHHDRSEGRPGAAQGWHLHHLLTAGQQELERIFPGIIDDMVREGAFKVDMAEQYQLRLAGSWKKACKGGIEIVCASRPLLEWCVRRRLDGEPGIDFRYDTEMQDLVYDAAGNRVLGVVVDSADGPQVLPAAFVVDASGKNTRLPEFLERIGTGAPALEQDILNCFYSTMRHHVPPERRWTDKVMVICYAYRPNEQTYAAQYYTDSSRTILSTSLIEYNCYSPPRNAAEFQVFAKRMQSPVVAELIDGLEPASPVYNFRSPRMQRYRYERLRKLPRSLVAIGDAYTSTDPVAGLGMTITLQEVAQLRALLSQHAADSAALPKRYFRAISRIADGAWFVIREQTLRFPWVKDVESKRPFYFRALNWYMDRLVELVHDDLASYRKFLAVIHLVKPPLTLMTPPMIARVIGKWLLTRLQGRQTLIERNFGSAQKPDSAPSTVQPASR